VTGAPDDELSADSLRLVVGLLLKVLREADPSSVFHNEKGGKPFEEERVVIDGTFSLLKIAKGLADALQIDKRHIDRIVRTT
jgi:hypothetical protein